MPSSVQVSWIQLEIPASNGIPQEGPCGCTTTCGCTTGSTCGGDGSPGTSSGPIRYATGEPSIQAVDFTAAGYGLPWGHTRSFASRLSENTNVGNGWNWLVSEWTYILRPDANTVIVQREALEPLFFDLVSGSYVGRNGIQERLALDSANWQFRLDNPDGSSALYQAGTGLLISRSDPAGNSITVLSRAANGLSPAEVERSTTTAGVTTTDSYVYTYTGTAAALSLTNVTLKRRVGSGAWANVLKADYTYYGLAESYGAEADLKTVTTSSWQDGAWDATGTTYYRYWLTLPGSSSSSSSSSGTASTAPHLLKFILNPAAYDRMVSDGYSNPTVVSDGILSQYADFYFEYDSSRRVIREAVKSGSQTFTFAYSTSGFSAGYNRWKTKTVETLPDDTQNIVYSNSANQTMLKVRKSGSSEWLTYWQYNSDGRVILQAEPSALTGYDDTTADLLDFNGGVSPYLRDDAGLLHVYTYHAPSGFLASESVQNGQLGTPILVRSLEYVPCGACCNSSSSSSSSGGGTSGPWFLSRSVEYPSATNPSQQLVTSYCYTWYPGTCAVQQRVTTLPVVPTDQNGSGVAATRREYFDEYGNLTWSMDERGYITRMKYNIPTGAVTQRIDDVDTSLVSDAPSGWTTPAGGGLHLISDYEHDDQGRTTQSLGPVHTVEVAGVATSVRTASWTVFKDALFQTWSAQGYATGSSPSYTYTLINPVSITITDAGGRVLEQIAATRGSGVTSPGRLDPFDSFAQSSFVRWSTTQYSDCCFVASRRVYHLIPASGEGTSGTNYEETDYGYDVMKRQNRVVTPGGTITRTVFDARSLPVSTWVGTNDNGATSSDPTGGGAPGNNMVQITGSVYDGGTDGGDGNLTQSTAYVDGSTTRVTTFTYDFRNRQVTMTGEIDVYSETTYDNLNRVTRTERYDTSSSGHLIARSDTRYDDRGRVYQSVRYAVDPSTGTVGNALTDNTWYDAAGHVIKNQPAGSDLFTKTAYDSLGRVAVTYAGYDLDETTYAEAETVTGDTLFEQAETVYDDASNVIQSTMRQRYHNATGTGELQDPGTQPKARVTYSAIYPDAVGRTAATADYGTNGGTALSRPSTIPARSDTCLVTSTFFNSRGEAYLTLDPAATRTYTEFDDAGRRTKLVENYQTSGSSSSSSSSGDDCAPSDDVNRTTLFGYNADGNLATLTAVNVATGNQVTTYTYGTTLADSDVASSLLKRSETYPDSVGDSDRKVFAYNRQSQVKQLTDQMGTVHTYAFDLLGRQTQDRITTLGSGVDGAVRRIAVTYDVRGLVETLTSYDHATVGSGAIVNQVQQVYNDFGQLVTEYQSHSGAVNTSTTPQVQYAYADGSANTIRPTSMTYPNGRLLTYSYGTAGGSDDAASRIAAYVDDDGTTHLADYTYLGQGSIVQVDSPQPGLRYTLIDPDGQNDPDTGDIYGGLDRFGRVKDLRWLKTGSSSSSSSGGAADDLVRIQHGYDRAGNRLYRKDPVAASYGKAFDELYMYDGLYRLKDMERGTLNAERTAITNGTATFAQCWTLDSTGNWQGFREDDDGAGSWDLVQARSANPVNEITGITNTVGSAWATPAYNAAGNMTTIPQPAAPDESYTATYDAWNRLVKLVDTGTSDTVQENAYDGRTFRTVRQDYTAGALSETRQFYYTAGWQDIEERVGTTPDSADADRQFVWGLRYIDDLVLRDRDTDANGTLDERLYGMQDPNWNMVAIADASGVVQERYAYSAYGVPEFLTHSYATNSASSLGVNYLYSGYCVDSSTMLYFIRYRILHPPLGSWISRDPRSCIVCIILYEFAGGQPISGLDPYGLAWWEYFPIISTAGHAYQRSDLAGTRFNDYDFGKCRPDFTRCRGGDALECRQMVEKQCLDCFGAQAGRFASAWTGSSFGADFVEAAIGAIVSALGVQAIRQGVAYGAAATGVGAILTADGLLDLGIVLDGLFAIQEKAKEVQSIICPCKT